MASVPCRESHHRPRPTRGRRISRGRVRVTPLESRRSGHVTVALAAIHSRRAVRRILNGLAVVISSQHHCRGTLVHPTATGLPAGTDGWRTIGVAAGSGWRPGRPIPGLRPPNSHCHGRRAAAGF